MHLSLSKFSSGAVRAALVAVLLFAGARLTQGCSSNAAPTVGSGSHPGPTGECENPAPGCPCTVDGQVAKCGTVEVKSGSSVLCSIGTTTCDGTTWGTCEGDYTVTERSIGGGPLHLLGLGTAKACGADGGPPANPCDPYCNGFTDTPGGFDASPLTATDSGLSIPVQKGACVCNEAIDSQKLFQVLPNPYQGDPAACQSAGDAGTGTDNCNHDHECVAGSCTPYSAGAVNAACTAAPDYTLGLGCSSNGTSWQLELCNRGYVPAPSLGTLWIAIGNAALSTPPGACVTGTGATWPTGPALAGNNADVGQCKIPLTTTSIGPGQCINVDISTQCTQLDGVTLLNNLTNNVHWVVVNPLRRSFRGRCPFRSATPATTTRR